MIKNCPIIPGKGMSDWLDKMEGVDCSGYFPTKEESRIGKSKAMKVYNARLKSDTQFWERNSTRMPRNSFKYANMALFSSPGSNEASKP